MCVLCFANMCIEGADPTLENNSGRKPINYCTDECVKDLLQEYSSRVRPVRGQFYLGCCTLDPVLMVKSVALLLV